MRPAAAELLQFRGLDGRERDRETETERQRDTQRDRDIQTQTEAEPEPETDRQTERERNNLVPMHCTCSSRVSHPSGICCRRGTFSAQDDIVRQRMGMRLRKKEWWEGEGAG